VHRVGAVPRVRVWEYLATLRNRRGASTVGFDTVLEGILS
jgi:hypothetical protein